MYGRTTLDEVKKKLDRIMFELLVKIKKSELTREKSELFREHVDRRQDTYLHQVLFAFPLTSALYNIAIATTNKVMMP